LSKDEQEVMINEALLVEQSKKMLELSKSHMSELNADKNATINNRIQIEKAKILNALERYSPLKSLIGLNIQMPNQATNQSVSAGFRLPTTAPATNPTNTSHAAVKAAPLAASSPASHFATSAFGHNYGFKS